MIKALDILGHSYILLDIMGLDILGLDILGRTQFGSPHFAQTPVAHRATN